MISKTLIGKRIKEIRERQQLQQIEVAAKINMSQSSLAKYESGVNLPNISTLIDIAKVCNATLDEFIMEEDASQDAVLRNITVRESQLINKFRSFPKDKQDALLTLLNLK